MDHYYCRWHTSFSFRFVLRLLCTIYRKHANLFYIREACRRPGSILLHIPQVKQCVGDVVASFHQAGNGFGPLRLGIVTYADFTTAEDYHPKVCWQVFPVVQRFCGRPCEGGREGGRGSALLTQAFRRISKPQFSRRHLSADDLLQTSLNSQEGPTLASRKQHGLSTAESSILQSTTEKSCVHGIYILKLRRCFLKML